jgi:hypothetical protein
LKGYELPAIPAATIISHFGKTEEEMIQKILIPAKNDSGRTLFFLAL